MKDGQDIWEDMINGDMSGLGSRSYTAHELKQVIQHQLYKVSYPGSIVISYNINSALKDLEELYKDISKKCLEQDIPCDWDESWAYCAAVREFTKDFFKSL